MGELSVLVKRRLVRLPSQAVVYRQPPVYLPGVLRIDGRIILAIVEPVNQTLAVRVGLAQHEICEGQARDRAIEVGLSHGVQTGPIVHHLPVDTAADSDLMRTLDPTDVFIQRWVQSVVRLALERPPRFQSGTRRWSCSCTCRARRPEKWLRQSRSPAWTGRHRKSSRYWSDSRRCETN